MASFSFHGEVNLVGRRHVGSAAHAHMPGGQVRKHMLSKNPSGFWVGQHAGGNHVLRPSWEGFLARLEDAAHGALPTV